MTNSHVLVSSISPQLSLVISTGLRAMEPLNSTSRMCRKAGASSRFFTTGQPLRSSSPPLRRSLEYHRSSLCQARMKHLFNPFKTQAFLLQRGCGNLRHFGNKMFVMIRKLLTELTDWRSQSKNERAPPSGSNSVGRVQPCQG